MSQVTSLPGPTNKQTNFFIYLDVNTKNKTLLEINEYYYSNRLSEAKDEKKNDNNGIKLIKEFIKNRKRI